MLKEFLGVLKRNPESKKRFCMGTYYNKKKDICCAIGSSNLNRAYTVEEYKYKDLNSHGDPNNAEIDYADMYDYFQLEELGVTKQEAKQIQEWNDNFLSKTQLAFISSADKTRYRSFDYSTETEEDFKDRYNYVVGKIEEHVKMFE